MQKRESEESFPFWLIRKRYPDPGSDIDIIVSGVSDPDHLTEELNQIDTLKK